MHIFISGSCEPSLHSLFKSKGSEIYISPPLESQRSIILRFLSNILTRIYVRPVDRIISRARSSLNGMHFLVHIYNYRDDGFRAGRRARMYMHSRRLTRHPVSCFCSFLFFSRLCTGDLEIQHVTSKRFTASRMHSVPLVVSKLFGSRGNAWKSFLE